MRSIHAGKKLDMEADKWLHINNCNGSYTLGVSNKKIKHCAELNYKEISL